MKPVKRKPRTFFKSTYFFSVIDHEVPTYTTPFTPSSQPVTGSLVPRLDEEQLNKVVESVTFYYLYEFLKVHITLAGQDSRVKMLYCFGL